MARDVIMNFKRGGGSTVEALYGEVSLTPTLLHTLAGTAVLPTPTKRDLIDGTTTFPNVAPTPAPIDGQVPWAYKVVVKDRRGKTFEFLVGVPDGTTAINFVDLPRYFETRPPAYGIGPAGPAGQSATIAVGSVTSGPTPTITNSGTSTEAVLNFQLQQGPQGPVGVGVPEGGSALQVVRKNADNTNTEWATIDKALAGLGNVDNTSDANKPVSVLQASAIADFGQLTIRSKLVTDAPSTFPHGTSVFIADVAQGWPQPSPNIDLLTMQVVTVRSKGRNGGATQWVSAFSDSTAPLLYRVADASDSWGAFKTSLSREDADNLFLGRNEVFFYPEDYWNAEIEPVNYKHTFERTIQAAQGQPIVLQSGKAYPTTATITNYGASAVNFRSSGAEPAYITSTGQSLSNLMWLQPGGGEDDDGGTVVHETTVNESIGINGRGWRVVNPVGVVPGMICAVVSSKLWYHDPRPGVGEARKSELHRVSRVDGTRIYFDDGANDGYNVAAETVVLKFYNPITVRIDNITFRAVLPAPAESTSATTGLRVDFALDPQITNVSVEGCARTGINMSGCYKGIVRGGYTDGANNFFNGYGVSVAGSAYFRVTERVIRNSRRGVDFSNIRIGVISRQCVVDNSHSLGGGVNSRGEIYGWLPDGNFGAYQGGFGSHAGVDTITYRNNFVSDMHAPFTTRGRTSIIESNLVIGRTTGGAVWSSYSTNLYVTGNKVLAGYWSNKDAVSYIPTSTSVHQMRADTLVTIYTTWEGNDATPYRGQVVITDNECELRISLLRMHKIPIGELYVSGNRATIVHPINTTNASLIDNQSGAEPSAGTKSRWFIGPNALVYPVGTGTATTFSGMSPTGVNVLNYTVSA